MWKFSITQKIENKNKYHFHLSNYQGFFEAILQYIVYKIMILCNSRIQWNGQIHIIIGEYKFILLKQFLTCIMNLKILISFEIQQ